MSLRPTILANIEAARHCEPLLQRVLGVGIENLCQPLIILGEVSAPRGFLGTWMGKGGSLDAIIPAGDDLPEWVMAGPLVIDSAIRGIARGRAVAEMVDAYRFAALAQGITQVLVHAGTREMRHLARRVSAWPEVGLRLLSQHGDIDLYCWDLLAPEATEAIRASSELSRDT